MPDFRRPKTRCGEYLSLLLDKCRKVEITLFASDTDRLSQGSADLREQLDLLFCRFFSRISLGHFLPDQVSIALYDKSLL